MKIEFCITTNGTRRCRLLFIIFTAGNIEMTAGVVFELTAAVGLMLCGGYIVIILLQKSEKKNAIFDTLFNFMSAPL